MAKRKQKQDGGRFLNYKELVAAFNASRDQSPEELVVAVWHEVDAALRMLGHAKDTAGALRLRLDDGDVEDDDELAELAMYLEDDIDEIENGVVYDLYVKLREAARRA